MPIAALVLAATAAGVPPFTPPPILMYHRVDVVRPRDAVGRSLTLQPQQFAAQMAFLKSQGLAIISMRDLYRLIVRRSPLTRVAVVTFDDGYADQRRYAVPLLQRFGGRATFYVVTGTLGHRNHLSWGELRAMSAQGMDIAAHGVQHDDLSLMTPAQQAFQIDTSVALVRERLKTPVYSYAYPSGRLNRETLRLVQSAHVPLGVTTDPTYVIRPENRFEMTRLRIKAAWNLGEFAKAFVEARARSVVVLGR